MPCVAGAAAAATSRKTSISPSSFAAVFKKDGHRRPGARAPTYPSLTVRSLSLPRHPCTGSHHVAQPVRDHPLRRPQLRPRRGRTLRPRQLLRSLPRKLHPGSRHLLRHAAHRPAHGRRGQARGQSRVRPHARPRRPRLRPLRRGDGQDADGLDVARRRGGEGEFYFNYRTGN